MPFSIQVCHWSYLVFVGCWLLEGNWNHRLALLKSNKLAFLFPLFFLVHVAGMFYTGNTASGWIQLEKKAAYFIIPLTLASTMRLSGATAQLLMKVFVAACVAGTLVCLGNASWMIMTGSPQQNFSQFTLNEFLRFNPDASMTWMNFSYATLSSGIGIHPTYFGLYLSLCLMILIYLSDRDHVTSAERRIAPYLFCYLLVFIFFLSSRITIIAAAAISMTALVVVARHRKWSFVLARQAFAVAAFALIVYSNPVSRYRGLQEPTAASTDKVAHATTSIDIRLSLLRLSHRAGPSVNPWIGAGTGSGVDVIRSAGAEHGITNVLDTYDPHNQFIYTFFELGSLGLLVLLAALFIPLYHAWKRRLYLYLGLALVFIAVCLTESALELQKGIVLFTFFGSLLLFHQTNPERTAR